MIPEANNDELLAQLGTNWITGSEPTAFLTVYDVAKHENVLSISNDGTIEFGVSTLVFHKPTTIKKTTMVRGKECPTFHVDGHFTAVSASGCSVEVDTQKIGDEHRARQVKS